MNRSSSAEAFLISSMMSFVGGLDATAALKQHHAAPTASSSWDNWDVAAGSHNPAAMAAAALQNHSFFLNPAPAMDCPSPLLPIGNFPLYCPPPPPPLPPAPQPEYLPVAGLVKRDLHHFGSGGRIGLNLGHRTYFSPGDALAIDRLLGRSRVGGMYSLGGGHGHGHHHQPPRCQAEGCRADLSGAKHYHRRHKVCEFHSKASVAVVAGLHQRFCQQCSRFHVLAEFDESKRSCRKRLADHNRRRRKPQVVLPAAAPPPPAAATADRSCSVSVSKDTNSNNSEKSKQLQKTTHKVSAKSTICSTKVGSKMNSNGEGVQQQQYPKQGNKNNGPAQSLGAVVAAEKDGNGFGLRSNATYQAQGPFSSVDKEIRPVSPQLQQQQNLQNYYLFSQAAAGHCDPAGRLHLGQFEVDYM